MARRSQSDRLLEMLETDLRLKLVGRTCAMVWLEVVRAICRYGEDQVLHLGSRMGSVIGSLNELAFALRMEVTELETHLETLFGRQLLVSVPAGGIAMPAELGLSARARAARINGLRGGRPRKDGRPPGQASMLLPIAGDAAAKPKETEPVTQPETHYAGASSSLPSSDSVGDEERESESSPGKEETEGRAREATPVWVSLAGELAALAGRRQPLQVKDCELVRGWLEAGASRELLMGVFRTVLARPSTKPNPPLSYFDGAVHDTLELERRTQGVSRPVAVAAAPPPPRPALPPEQQALDERRARLWAQWHADRRGPLPPTCSALVAWLTAPAGLERAALWVSAMEDWRAGTADRPEEEFEDWMRSFPDEIGEIGVEAARQMAVGQ